MNPLPTFDMLDSVSCIYDSYGNYHEGREYDEYNELAAYTNSITKVLNSDPELLKHFYQVKEILDAKEAQLREQQNKRNTFLLERMKKEKPYLLRLKKLKKTELINKIREYYPHVVTSQNKEQIITQFLNREGDSIIEFF